jgi:hypothetical protein
LVLGASLDAAEVLMLFVGIEGWLFELLWMLEFGAWSFFQSPVQKTDTTAWF